MIMMKDKLGNEYIAIDKLIYEVEDLEKAINEYYKRNELLDIREKLRNSINRGDKEYRLEDGESTLFRFLDIEMYHRTHGSADWLGHSGRSTVSVTTYIVWDEDTVNKLTDYYNSIEEIKCRF